MVKVKPLSQAQANYGSSGGRAGTNYKSGVQSASDWQANASSDRAESLWAAKVSEAASAKRRQKAVAAVSNADWQSRAAGKGAQSIGPAITASADKWGKGFNPYSSTLAGVTLPDRSTDGLQNLAARAGAIVSALHAKKKEIKG